VNFAFSGSGKKKPLAPVSTEPVYVRPGLVAIDVTAGAGRAGLRVGDTVRILGTGLFSGDSVVVEKLSGTAIPSAIVRTADGRTRHVRTIDLEPVGPTDAGATPPA
jgi:hypothetical protein